jgi:hypothetical protein
VPFRWVAADSVYGVGDMGNPPNPCIAAVAEQWSLMLEKALEELPCRLLIHVG